MSTFTISLPHSIAVRVDEETKEKGFATRSEFIRSLLRKYFSSSWSLEEFKSIPINEVKSELKKSGKYNQKFIDSVSKGLSKSSMYER